MRINSFLIVQDSTRHFTLHATVDSDEAMKTQFEQVVAMPVQYEMLSCAPWRQNLLLADSYGKDRVFLAGDAVHLVIPTGGLGMNSGVGDAIDLSWKLAATLQGWGGPGLLASYEAERRPVGARNVEASRHASRGRRAWRAAYKPNIRDNTPEGAATRANLAAHRRRRAAQEQRDDRRRARLPLCQLADRLAGSGRAAGGRSLDICADDLAGRAAAACLARRTARRCMTASATATRCFVSADRQSGADALARAFAAYGAPFPPLAVNDEHARDIYGYDLLLLRPDLHVVWRGNRLPDDAAKLAAIATGH